MRIEGRGATSSATELASIRDEALRELGGRLVASPGYQGLTDQQRAEALRKVVEVSGSVAGAAMKLHILRENVTRAVPR
jgi:hypothetical protein